MTYTDHINLSNEGAEPPSDTQMTTLQKLKVLQQETTQRSKRVAKILQAAFSETAEEFKAGRSVVSPLAKEVTAETVTVVKANGQKVSDTVNQMWQDAEEDDLTERIIGFVRMLGAAAKEKLFPQLKRQANKFDSSLSERYGDRYANLKAQLNEFRNGAVVVPEKASPTSPVESNSADTPAIEVTSEVVG
ncbi:MAG: hypothetical protein AAF703_09315 [Cyanobacteria bacterium P01_D01_bin.105]